MLNIQNEYFHLSVVELKYAIFNLLQTLTIVLKSNLLRWLTKLWVD